MEITSLPQDLGWYTPFGDLPPPKPKAEIIDNIHVIHPHSFKARLNIIREHQTMLSSFLDEVIVMSDEALAAVTDKQRKMAEVNIRWMSVNRIVESPLELACKIEEPEAADHMVLLPATNDNRWHPLLENLFPSMAVATTMEEQRSTACVVSFDARKHDTDSFGIPAHVRFVYPRAARALQDRLAAPEGPLYSFMFKTMGQQGPSFTAILRPH